MLEAFDGLFGENWKKHLTALFCLRILQEHEGSSGDSRGSVQASIFVPSFAAMIDVVECRWASKMQLGQ